MYVRGATVEQRTPDVPGRTASAELRSHAPLPSPHTPSSSTSTPPIHSRTPTPGEQVLYTPRAEGDGEEGKGARGKVRIECHCKHRRSTNMAQILKVIGLHKG